MIMCSRFDTIPACDGQTDRQTDRQTSCYSICAMHNVARKKTTSYERLSLTGTAGFGLNESSTKLSTSFARHSHDNSEREIQAFSAVSYILPSTFGLRPPQIGTQNVDCDVSFFRTVSTMPVCMNFAFIFML